jgi:capsular polysaccharide biosynthesis protein
MRRPAASVVWAGSSLRLAAEALRRPGSGWKGPAFGAIAAAALAWAWQAVWPPTYTATARIVVDPSAAEASGAAGEWIATQAEIIGSEAVARRVAADLGLTADRLLGQLAVEPSPRGSLLGVSYANVDPAFAAQVADAFVAAYERVSQDMRTAAASAIEERARARVSALREEVERAQARLDAAERAQSQGGLPKLAQAMQLARLAPPVDWSGLPGEEDRGRRSGSLLADTEHAALDGASFERVGPQDPVQDARSDLDQATQAFAAARARLVQFESERMLARPAMSVLSGARESTIAPNLNPWRIVLLAALCGLVAGWASRTFARRIDRRVVGPKDLARIDGLAVFGVLNDANAAPPRLARQPVRPLPAHGGAIPALS